MTDVHAKRPRLQPQYDPATGLELAMARAEETYFKTTGRTRYQFVIDALDLLTIRLVMMGREELGKAYLEALADELNQCGSGQAHARRKQRTAEVQAALKSSILMLPHRRDPACNGSATP